MDLNTPDPDLGIDIIAPLWSYFENSPDRMTYSQETEGHLLDLATEAVNNVIPYAIFNASYAFIATWDRVPFRIIGGVRVEVLFSSYSDSPCFIFQLYSIKHPPLLSSFEGRIVPGGVDL